MRLFTPCLRTTALLLLLLTAFAVQAQFTTISTLPTFTNNNGSGQVTFNFQNNNPYPVRILEIKGFSVAGNQAASFWFKPTPINGLPGVISAANGWTEIAAGTVSISGTNVLTTFFTGLNFQIPAGQTYGLMVYCNSQPYHTIPAALLPTISFSGGGCSLIAGTNISYGGGIPNTSAPTFTPRGWLGEITFEPVSTSPCVAPPNAGTATASVNPVCPSAPFSVGLTGSSTGIGLTYQWASSTNNVTYTNITGATNSNYFVTNGISQNTWFRCTVTCSGQSATATVLVNTQSFVNCYCPSAATSTADEEILNVTFGALSNSSTCSTTGGPGSVLNLYSDYTATVAPPTVQPLQVVPFSIQNGTCGGNFSNNTKIFIDWNRNGLFTDPDEEVYASPTTISGPNTRTGNITVPLNASPGTTRMRVVTVETSSITAILPCGTYTWGETEDYLINIAAAGACTAPPNAGTATASINPVCPSVSFNVGLNGNSVGTGQTYQWASSTDNITYTNITGATGPFYTVTNGITANTWYRCTVTCSGQSATATVAVNVQSFTGCYCASNATSNADTEILGVSFGSLNNPSTCTAAPGPGSASGQYSNFTTSVPPPNVAAAQVVPFSVILSTCSASEFTKSAKIFIDWNRNGLLTDPGEEAAVTATAFSGFATWSGTITVPTTAQAGQTVMRVVCVETSIPTSITPCGTYTWGETEDYLINVAPSSPCTAPPNPGAASASVNPVCPSVGFTVSLSGNSFGSGQTYQWSSSTDNVTFTPIAGATDPFYTATGGITANTWFRCTVTCSGQSASATVLVNVQNFTGCFCASNATSSADTEIRGVSFGSMNNPSTCTAAPGPGSLSGQYSNFTTSVPAPNVVQLQTIPYSVILSTCSATEYTKSAKIFIDWNQNGLFTDPGEEAAVTPTALTGLATWSGTITIPVTAAPGQTLMRVVCVETSAPASITPCGTYTWGETEDYLINVVPAIPCSGVPNAGNAVSSRTSVCVGDNFLLSLNGATLGTGLSYQWQSSPNGTSGWTNVTGGNADFISISQTATSYYRCIVTCTNSSQSATSTSVMVESPVLVQGNFTINAAQATGGTNFQNFNDAVNYIACGIGGPVVFDVISGIYNEQIAIGAIGGVSATNTVTFRNATSNTTPAELRFDGTSANNYVVSFTNGAQYVRFDGLTLSNINSTYGRVFSFFGTNSFLTIENCTLNSNPVTTTSTFNAVMFFNSATADVAQNITIRNNVINNGSYGIYFYGNTTTKEANNSVLNNLVQNFYYMGVYFYYHQDGVVSGNTIVQNNPGSTTVYGLYYYFCDRGAVEGNRVVTRGTSTNYAMYIYQPLGGSLNPVKVANNMASALGSAATNYAMFLFAAVNVDLFHNSLHVTGGSVATSAGLNLDRSTATTGVGGNLKVYNNIISNTSGVGPAVIIRFGVASQPMLSQMNYNNLYATGPILVRRYATSTTAFVDYSTLQDWRTAGFFFDLNSVSLDPLFFSDTDLHVAGAAMNNIGDPGNSMPTDIDGDIRCPNAGCPGGANRPDIGADEFLPAPNDVAVTSLGAPCPGGDLLIGIQNFGTAVLNTVVLDVEVNNTTIIANQAYNVGPIPSGGTDVIAVSGLTFSPGVSYTVTATLSAPNAGVDGNPNNNSRTQTSLPALNGTYTIGGTGADFATFSAAATALNTVGVCGPVLFLCRPGIYTEQMNLNNFPGSSPFNFVVFAPDPAFSGNVEMRFQGTTATNNYVLQLNGARYLAFLDLTFTHISNATYGRVVNFTGSVENITFSGNTFNGVSTTSTSQNFATINNNSGATNNVRNVVFEDNDVNNGAYGFYWWGNSTTDLEPGNVFLNNEVRGFFYMGLYAYYQNGMNATGNIFVQEGSVSSTGWGIYSISSERSNINRNQVVMNSGSTSYGIQVSTVAATISDRSRVSNNFVVCKMPASSGTAYGIYVSGTTAFLDVVHNSVHVTGGSTAARALYVLTSTVVGAGNNRILNNIFASSGAGYAAYFSSTTAPNYITQMDRNNLFTTGARVGFYGGDQANLAAWQAASPYDDNSISVNSLFVTAEDLHVNNPLLNARGELGTGIFEDIDQEVRCPDANCAGNEARPDIGADEFEPVPVDMEVGVVSRPLDGKSCDYSANEVVEVTVRNFGTQAINFAVTPLTITVTITGPVNQTVSRTVTTGTIQPFEVQFLEVGTANFTAGGLYNFAISISMPGDGRPGNNDNLLAGKVTVEQAVTAFPYLQDFNTFTLCSTAPQAACVLSGGWFNEIFGENLDWIVNSGATPTTLSGPNSGFGGGSSRYVYMEPDAAGQRATLNSPCFNVSAMACPALSFYYHMAGASIGSLRVEAQATGSGTWNTVWQLNGPQQANEADAWRRAEVNLSAYQGRTVRFRFVAESNGVASDIAIDDVSVYDVNSLAPGALDFNASIGQSSTCDEFVFGYNFSGFAPSSINWSIAPGTQGIDWRLLNGTTLNSSQIVLEFSTPGTYAVKMDANICGQVRSVSKTYTIATGVPQANFTQNLTNGTTATTFTFTDNSYPQSNSRQWTFGPISRPGIAGFDYVFVSGNASSNPVSVRFIRPGPYSVRLFIDTRCGLGSFSRANWITVTAPAGQEGDDALEIGELPNTSALEVFPNPFAQSFNVNFYAPADGKVSVRLNNMLGQTLQQRDMQAAEGENNFVIDGSKLAVGVYILHLTQNGETQQVKVVKE